MAVELLPNDPYPYDSRGLVYLKMRDFKKALADYDQSLLLLKDRASSLYGRGIARLKTDTAGGDADIDAARKINSNITKEFQSYGVQ